MKGESRRRRVGRARERNGVRSMLSFEGCFMVTPVDKPHSTPIFVALDQVRHCPDDLPPDQSWPS